MAAFSPPACTESPQPASASATVAKPAASITARLVMTERYQLGYNVIMAVKRLNHAVLYVRDAETTARFYETVLDFERLPMGFPGAVFIRAPGSTNDHDLGLFSIGDQAKPSDAGRDTVGLYHLAWEVDTLTDLEELADRLRSRRRPGGFERPRDDQEPLRQGSQWPGVRGRLGRPRRSSGRSRFVRPRRHRPP